MGPRGDVHPRLRPVKGPSASDSTQQIHEDKANPNYSFPNGISSLPLLRTLQGDFPSPKGYTSTRSQLLAAKECVLSSVAMA